MEQLHEQALVVARLREHIKQHAEKVERVLNKEEEKEVQLGKHASLKLYRATGEKQQYRTPADDFDHRHLDYPGGKYKKRCLS